MVVTRTYQGAWLLVDNGYLAWPTTVPPMKTTSCRVEIRLLAWLESMQKDVEWTFGILKGHWQILKTGVQLSGVDAADKIFLTCCALHNRLLETNGLTSNLKTRIPAADPFQPSSDWDGPLGQHDPEDLRLSPAQLWIHTILWQCNHMICQEWDQEWILCLQTSTTATLPTTLLWTKYKTMTRRPMQSQL